MIIDYDRNQNRTDEQKLQSLMESVQMALNELSGDIKRLKGEMAFVKDRYVSEPRTASSATSIAAGEYKAVTINIAKGGYTPIGIVGMTAVGAASGYCCVASLRFTSSTATIGVKNTHSSAATYTPTVRVLYKKN